MTYNSKLVNDYINGNDIEGYSIDELENDPLFMKSVILTSNDKNFYNLCSENVKHDYEFVDFLISKYNNDYKFIDEVANYYISNCDNEDYRICIIIKMCNILENSKNSNLFAKYRILFLAKFLTDMVDIEKYKIDHPNDKEVGLGFLLFFDKYNSNEEVLKYYSIHLINYIFDELNVNLENILHLKYKNPDDIRKDGIIKFMINFIREYDQSLADYASHNLDVLNNFKERICKVQVKWNNYINREEESKYMLMYERVHKYMEEHQFESVIGENGFIYYIGKELRISDKLDTYIDLDKITYEQLYGDIDNEFIQLTLSDFKERMFYINIKKIMLETLFDEYKEENTESKIVEVGFSK